MDGIVPRQIGMLPDLHTFESAVEDPCNACRHQHQDRAVTYRVKIARSPTV